MQGRVSGSRCRVSRLRGAGFRLDDVVFWSIQGNASQIRREKCMMVNLKIEDFAVKSSTLLVPAD